jgi:16S rRNA U516 pseudouridylate synthase RsuA-like enzyme
VLPSFASEAEELAFWDANDPADWIEGPADTIVRLKKRAPKRSVTMRLDEGLYNEIREVAAEHGLPYQRLMRELLRSSLRTLRAKGKRRTPAKAT